MTAYIPGITETDLKKIVEEVQFPKRLSNESGRSGAGEEPHFPKRPSAS